MDSKITKFLNTCTQIVLSIEDLKSYGLTAADVEFMLNEDLLEYNRDGDYYVLEDM